MVQQIKAINERAPQEALKFDRERTDAFSSNFVKNLNRMNTIIAYQRSNSWILFKKRNGWAAIISCNTEYMKWILWSRDTIVAKWTIRPKQSPSI